MTSLPFETYRLELTPLSPVHIGSGETIEPYEYVLKRENGATFLIAIDLPRLIASLDTKRRSELDDTLDRADFVVLRSWLNRNANPSRCKRFAVQVQDSAVREIEQCIDDPDRAGRIELMCRRANDGVPYIPGSSIKGAIRTAVVDKCLRSKSSRRDVRQVSERLKGSQLEAMALGHSDDGKRIDLRQDPFRQIAIADIALRDDSCYIDQVRIVRRVSGNRQANDEAGIQIYRDLTWSLLDGESETYVGEMRHYTGLHRQQTKQGRAVACSISVSEIIKACNEYYVEEVERQLNEFTPRDTESDEQIREPLLKATKSLKEHECIVRVGRHSHFECVVFSKPFNEPPKRGYGKTRTYVDGRLPLGWVKLGFKRATSILSGHPVNTQPLAG